MSRNSNNISISVSMCIFILVGVLFPACDYYDAIEPDNLTRPSKNLPVFYGTDYISFEWNDIKLQMTEGDYIIGCERHIYYEEQINDRSDDFSYKIHFLASGRSTEVFEDELYISIQYKLDDFEFDAENADIVVYRYDLYDGPHRMDHMEFEILPWSIDDKENQVVKVKTKSLRGSYILGRL